MFGYLPKSGKEGAATNALLLMRCPKNHSWTMLLYVILGPIIILTFRLIESKKYYGAKEGMVVLTI